MSVLDDISSETKHLTLKPNIGGKILAKQFYEADLVMMPSRTEGFSLAALEALSAGLPVLVSHNSGIGKSLKKVPNGSYTLIANVRPPNVCDTGTLLKEG